MNNSIIIRVTAPFVLQSNLDATDTQFELDRITRLVAGFTLQFKDDTNIVTRVINSVDKNTNIIELTEEVGASFLAANTRVICPELANNFAAFADFVSIGEDRIKYFYIWNEMANPTATVASGLRLWFVPYNNNSEDALEHISLEYNVNDGTFQSLSLSSPIELCDIAPDSYLKLGVKISPEASISPYLGDWLFLKILITSIN